MVYCRKENRLTTLEFSMVFNMTIRDYQFKFLLLVFFYTLLGGLFIQTVALPILFPNWHAGHGLLAGTDSVPVLQIASLLADRITQSGWKEWELQPDNQLMAGITALFYYFLPHEPWIMLPFNALIHMGSTYLILILLHSFGFPPRKQILSALPFAFFPSAFIWTSQLLKDGLSALGYLLIAFATIRITQITFMSHISRSMVLPCISYIIGGIILGITRPYMILISAIISLICVSIGYFIGLKRKVPIQIKLRTAFSIVFCAIGIQYFTSSHFYLHFLRNNQFQPNAQEVWPSLTKTLESFHWQKSTLLPAILDQKLELMAKQRFLFQKSDEFEVKPKSVIDSDIKLETAQSLFLYLPRALQISLFSPFPSSWFQVGSLESTTALRKVCALETIIVYFLLIGVFAFATVSWRKYEFWLVMILCIPYLWFLGLTVGNWGTLYRIRYPFLMMLCALGPHGLYLLYRNIKYRALTNFMESS
jgi:hypothetical protein